MTTTHEITIANGVKVKPGDTVYSADNESVSHGFPPLIVDRPYHCGAVMTDEQAIASDLLYRTRNEAIAAVIASQQRIFKSHFYRMVQCETTIAELEGMKDST